MGIDEARAHLDRFYKAGDIIEFAVSSATVDLAAAALGVVPGRIAKTLAFSLDGGSQLVLFAGDARVSNAKYKARFGSKPRFLSADEAFDETGHRIGGVCPFGLKKPLPVWLDESLRRFDVVYPACGSSNSALRCGLGELELMSGAVGWVDVSELRPAS